MTNMRRILKTPTLRMNAGGDLQVPTGPGMDRAGYLARNPGVVPPVAAAGPNPTDLRLGAGSQAAPSAPIVPGVTGPSLVTPAPQKMFGSGNSFGDAASLYSNNAPQSAQDQQAVSSLLARTPNIQGAGSSAFNMAPGALRRPAADSGAFTSTFKPMEVPGMKDGGDLRTGHGGHVPGSGSGDKIPAKYEPGEFVVSNDMLDAAPGLREQLHGLRGNVLASKGMTPEQADAKAVSGGGLRAVDGYDPMTGERYQRPVAPPPMPAGVKLPHAYELDMSNNVLEQKLPAATVTANRVAADQLSAKLDASREVYTRRANASLGMNQTELMRLRQGPLAGATTSPGAAAPVMHGNNIEFAAERPQLQATTSPGAAAPRAPEPSSMTRAQLFSQPPSTTPNNPNGPLQLRPLTPASTVTNAQQSALYAANDAVAAARGAAPVARPGIVGRTLEAAGGLVDDVAKSKLVAPVLRALDSPVGRTVSKLGGVGAQFATYHGEAGAPTLDAERVEAMKRPFDPNWRSSMDPANPGQPLRAPAARPDLRGYTYSAGDATMPGQDPGRTQATAPKAGDVRNVDWEGVLKPDGTQDQFDGKVWRSVSTAQGKVDSALRSQQYQTRLDKDAATSRADQDRQNAYFEREANAGKPQFINAYKAGTDRAQAENSLRGAQLQSATAMRGQDITERDNMRTNETSLRNSRATNMLGMFNAQREQGNRDRDHELAKGKFTNEVAISEADRAKKMFAGTQFRTNDKGEPVEDHAAQEASYQAYLNMTDGKVLTEPQRLAAEADAKRHGKLVAGMRQKAQEKNDGMFNTVFGRDALPTDIAPNAQLGEVGTLRGAYTGHGVKGGDYDIGGQMLPGDIDEDVLKYQLRRNQAYAAQQARTK